MSFLNKRDKTFIVKIQKSDLKVAVLGSHRGLGYECVKALLALDSGVKVLGLSRQDSGDFNTFQENQKRYEFLSFDFTKAFDDQALFTNLTSALNEFQPTHLIYCAGGGPYGAYFEKAWKDHEWAIKLNFLFPAKLIWHLAKQPSLKTFAYVGSAIAESDQGDPMGPSYAAAKWAMKGLLKSLNGLEPHLEFKIYSPGYMDTDLVPQGAAPRKAGELQDPAQVAQDILRQLRL